MYRTITIGSSILAQGLPVRQTPEGRLVIRLGNRLVQGWPTSKAPMLAPRDDEKATGR